MASKATKFMIICIILWFSARCSSRAVSVCPDNWDAACSDDEFSDDTNCLDSEAGGNSDEWRCPVQIFETCPKDLVRNVPLLLEAKDFGEGTRFIDVAPWIVLAERKVDVTQMIYIIDCRAGPCSPEDAMIAHLEVDLDTGLHPVALASGLFNSDSRLTDVAVLCDATSCSLWGASLDPATPKSELQQLAGGELPAGATINGLWWSPHTPTGLLCAYGNGIHCFDGTSFSSPWKVIQNSPLFNDMASYNFDGYTSGAIAVGELGRISFSGFPEWDGYWGKAYADWLTIATTQAGYAIAGVGGNLAVKNDLGDHRCVLGEEDIVDLVALHAGGIFGSPGGSLGITSSGRIFVDEGDVAQIDEPCFTGQVLGANPKAVAFQCGISSNVFLMDETALYGTTGCAVD